MRGASDVGGSVSVLLMMMWIEANFCPVCESSKDVRFSPPEDLSFSSIHCRHTLAVVFENLREQVHFPTVRARSKICWIV